MSKLDDPIVAVSRAVQLIRDRLPDRLSRELAEPLDTIERAVEQIVEEWTGDMRMNRELRAKGRRKPSRSTMDNDRKLWEERQGKTWKMFFADHPGEEEEKLRTAVRRHEARVKLNAKREAVFKWVDRLVADHGEDC
jgi:hypothetical protein